MTFRIWPALFLGLSLSITQIAFCDVAEDLALAKSYLKDYLKEVNQKYPFPEWEKQVIKSRANLNRLRLSPSFSEGRFDRNGRSQLEAMAREIQGLSKRGVETEALIKDLYVASMVKRIDGVFIKNGKRWDPEAKLAFEKALTPYEAGSLRPKTEFLGRVNTLEREFLSLKTDWQYLFAQDYLGRRVEDQIRANNLAKVESLYDNYSLQLEYWTRQMPTNASQTAVQLQLLSGKFGEKKIWLRQSLESLLEVLNTDFLFSDLLEYARKEKIELTLEVEEKIEASLKEKNRATVAPIETRLALWKKFAIDLSDRINSAAALAKTQQNQAMAKAEQERMEKAKMQALEQEQKMLEQDQKQKFKQTLSALKTFTFKSETTVELDDDSKKALKTKTGFLKTTYVRSGVNKLKVEKSRFNDTLALVQKFSIEAGSVDFSNMSLQERSNQSAYTYVSPAGRTSQGDLENFVAEVALGSFSTYFNFLSFVAPPRWRPGNAVVWTVDRAKEKASQDREFSYVDMVVDAHRKRSNTPTRSESTDNLPANMIVIFDPKGAIIRFQSFADVGQVTIRKEDLVDGKLHYKFLNYSTDQQNIYLNGIDAEMKVGIPAG